MLGTPYHRIEAIIDVVLALLYVVVLGVDLRTWHSNQSFLMPVVSNNALKLAILEAVSLKKETQTPPDQ